MSNSRRYGQRLERFCETNPIYLVRKLGLNSHYPHGSRGCGQSRGWTTANDLTIRHTLEAAGVEFIDENGGGPGVQLRNCQKPRRPK